MKPNFRIIIAAIISAVCAAAGTVATYAPDGQVQATAAAIANQCEANGVKAYPTFPAPAPTPQRDAGTPAVPTTPAPAPAAPSSAGVGLHHDAVRSELSLAAQRWLPAETWPGESRGWA